MALLPHLTDYLVQRTFRWTSFLSDSDEMHLEKTWQVLDKYCDVDCVAIHSFLPWNRPRLTYNPKGAAYLLRTFRRRPEGRASQLSSLEDALRESLARPCTGPADLFDKLQGMMLLPGAEEPWLEALVSGITDPQARRFERWTFLAYMQHRSPEACRQPLADLEGLMLKDLMVENAFKDQATTQEMGYALLALNQLQGSPAFEKSLDAIYQRIHRVFVSKKYLPTTFRGKAPEISLAGNLLFATALMQHAASHDRPHLASDAFYLIDQAKFFQRRHGWMLPTYFPPHRFHSPFQYPVWMPCYMVWALDEKQRCTEWLRRRYGAQE
ncbi:MAG: hypothetical protein P8R54_15200 [Myxococcota bacterium]|nr:hypothetical protein [Myxococcota bacterium]